MTGTIELIIILLLMVIQHGGDDAKRSMVGLRKNARHANICY